jgi:hypothetical protein
MRRGRKPGECLNRIHLISEASNMTSEPTGCPRGQCVRKKSSRSQGASEPISCQPLELCCLAERPSGECSGQDPSRVDRGYRFAGVHDGRQLIEQPWFKAPSGLGRCPGGECDGTRVGMAVSPLCCSDGQFGRGRAVEHLVLRIRGQPGQTKGHDRRVPEVVALLLQHSAFQGSDASNGMHDGRSLIQEHRAKAPLGQSHERCKHAR